jgi:hypothetical protein
VLRVISAPPEQPVWRVDKYLGECRYHSINSNEAQRLVVVTVTGTVLILMLV